MHYPSVKTDYSGKFLWKLRKITDPALRRDPQPDPRDR